MPEDSDFDISRDVLFMGLGQSAVCYYRIMLPAMALGADWIGVAGGPPKMVWVTGLAKDIDGQPQSVMPDFFKYKVIVMQQPAGKGYEQMIEALQDKGIKVIYEIDDYVHGIKHLDDHDFQKNYDNEYLGLAERAMKKADALIASTEWIRGNYSHFNKRAYLCQNGIDIARYNLTRPSRSKINVGWAGATGHTQAIIPWLQQVAALMRVREDVCFVSVGQPFADAFKQHFPEERAISVPFAAVEQYPSAMTMFDVALAPGGKGGWWRGKSDLRWLEAGALGIPIIANPYVYSEIEDGVTGFHARSPQEAGEILAALVSQPDLRTTVGEKAKAHISQHRSAQAVAHQWERVLSEVVNS